MKTINIMKQTVGALALLSVIFLSASCSDDLLDRQQQNALDDETYWTQESNLRLFATEFYPQFFVGYNTSWTMDYTFRGYMFSDDVVYAGPQDLFEVSVLDALGSGNNTASTSGAPTAPAWRGNQWAGPTWYFGWIRKANLMENRIETRMQSILTPEQSNHWTAVARFFKALDYCRLVSVFGDVPHFEKEFTSAEKDIMYKDRTPRGEVMDKVYDDFKYVMSNMRTADGSQTLNKYIAAAFISRWMLFEGTWQKYHNNDNTRAQKYLEFAVEASDFLMSSAKYAIDADFHTLFGSENLATNKECILYRHYENGLVMHCIASYNQVYIDEGQPRAANLDLVKAFICNDGEVYQNSSVANAGEFDIANLVQTRDPRFEASFLDRPTVKAAALLFTDKFIDRAGANATPPIPTKYTATNNVTDAPVIRYGEILLNWVEAKAELATVGGSAVTQGDIDKSINVLRDRPLDAEATGKGVVKTAPMSLTALPDDPARDADVSALIWEIRRERRMELFMEPARLLDIKRWKKINYMKGTVKPDILKGIWVNLPVEMPDLVAASKVGLTKVEKADGTVVTFDGTNAADMVGFYLPENVQDRNDYTDRVYLSPIGKNQIDLYKSQGYTLKQTTGWE